MLARYSSRWLAAGVILLSIAACNGPAPAAPTQAPAPTAKPDATRLEDGLYAVLSEATTPEGARLDAAGHVVLPYDGRFSGEAHPTRYLALSVADHVPLILEGAPHEEPDERGRKLLSVTLAKPQVHALESFTRAHLGSAAAIVLDGEVVTVHKIKAVIDGGRLQISWCSGNACQVLRGKLQD